MGSEIEFASDTRRGDRGLRVRRVQEWLSLHGLHVRIDGDFGPATEEAVRRFQDALQLTASGVVDEATFEHLVAPAVAAIGGAPRAGDGGPPAQPDFCLKSAVNREPV